MADLRGSATWRPQETLAASWPATFPAGLSGDTQVLIVVWGPKGNSLATPSGWSWIGEAAHSTAPGKVAIFTRYLSADVSAGTVNISFSAGTTSGETVGLSFDGIVDVLSSFVEINWSTPGAQFYTVTPPGLTASADDSVYVAVAVSAQYPRNATVSAPAVDIVTTRTNPQEHPSIELSKKVVDSGAVSPDIFTWIAPYGGDASAESIAFSLVLKPLGGSPPPPGPPSGPPPGPPPSGGIAGAPLIVAAPPVDACVTGGYETIVRGSALAENNQWAFGAWGLSGGAGGTYQSICLGPQSSSGANSFRIQAYVPRNWPDPGGTVSEVKSYPAVYWGQVPGFAGYPRLQHPNLPIKAGDIDVCYAGFVGLDDSNMSAFGHLSHDMRLVDTDEDIDGYVAATPHIRVELFVVIKQYEGYGAHPNGRAPTRYMGMYNIGGRDWHFYIQPGASLNPVGGPNPQMIWLPNVWPLPNPLDMAPLFRWGMQTRYQDLKQNAGNAIYEYGKGASDLLIDPDRWFTHNAMGFEVIEGTVDISGDSAYFRVNQDYDSGGPPPPPPPVSGEGYLPAHFDYSPGWASTVGGNGGTIVKVTNLNTSGAGSLKAAIDTSGARTIVFEVSGVIDLNGAVWTINEPYCTIAGQTAPSPGITIIKGAINTKTHDVIVQHLRIRTGSGAGPNVDALEALDGSIDVIFDHNSLSWGTDEILSAGGYPFTGTTIQDFRDSTAHRVTFSNNIVAEPLTNESGYGTLVEDNVRDILLYRNLWAHCPERSPNFGGGTSGAVINNLIYNPGDKFVDYTFLDSKWDAEGGGQRVVGEITAIGNVGLDGPDSAVVGFMVAVSNRNVDYYGLDNIAKRLNGTDIPQTYNSTYLSPQGIVNVVGSPPVTAPGVVPIAATAVEASLLPNIGARPWDRDATDVRIISSVISRAGSHLSSESAVGGYPASIENTKTFNPAEWDLATMRPISFDGPPPGGPGDLQAADGTTVVYKLAGGTAAGAYPNLPERAGQSNYIAMCLNNADTVIPAISSAPTGWALIYSSPAAVDRPNRIFLWEKIEPAASTVNEFVTFNLGTVPVYGIVATFLIDGVRVGMLGNPTTQSDYSLIAQPPTVSPPSEGAFAVSMIGTGNYSRTLVPRFGGVRMMSDWQPVGGVGVSLAIGKQTVTASAPQPVAWDPTDPETPGAEAGEFWRMLTLLFSPLDGSTPPGDEDIMITIAGNASFISAPGAGAISSIGQTFAAVSWVDNSNDETGFIVRVLDPSTGVTIPFAVGANVTNVNVTSLQPGKNYSVTVVAIRDGAISAPSLPLGFSTLPGNNFTLSASAPTVAFNELSTIIAQTTPESPGQTVLVSLSPSTFLAMDGAFSGVTDSNGRISFDLKGLGVDGSTVVTVTIGGVVRTVTIGTTSVVEGVVLRINPARFEKDVATVAVVTGTVDGRSLIGRQVTISSTNTGVIANPASFQVVPTTTGGGEARAVLYGLENGTATLTATIEGVDSNEVSVVVEQPEAPADITASGVAMLALTAESPLAVASRPRVRRLTQADLQARFPSDRGLEAADITARTNYIFLTPAAVLRKS